ncbi:hypothetical protein IKP85_04730 [bacterium]|nr:hypothetical protein [bacterium]
MKKYLLVIGVIALLVTGCAKKNDQATTDDEIDILKGIAKELAVAAANDDNEKMIKYSNTMMSKNAKPKEILLKDNCYEVIYFYLGQEESVKYCK